MFVAWAGDCWSDVVVDPLSFAARAIPALKGEDVISHSWSKFFYNDLRKRATAQEASYYHGYLLVVDSILDQALRDSGTQGVFLSPRSHEKTRDPRYRVIPCAGPFEQVKARALGCENALGLAQLQSGYGIMVRQELFNEVKSHVAPGALVERFVAPSSRKFLALNLPNSLTATQVTDAMQQLGWESARAIRPLRTKTWLIGAESEPPSFHFRSGDFMIMVAPFDSQSDSADQVMVAPTAIAQDVCMEPKLPMQERFDTLRATLREDLRTFLHEEVASACGGLEQRVGACELMSANTIETVSQVQHVLTNTEHSLVRLNQSAASSEHQVAQLSAKVESLESDVRKGHFEVLQQMRALFAEHDAKLENRFAHSVASNNDRLSAVEAALKDREVRRRMPSPGA